MNHPIDAPRRRGMITVEWILLAIIFGLSLVAGAWLLRNTLLSEYGQLSDAIEEVNLWDCVQCPNLPPILLNPGECVHLGQIRLCYLGYYGGPGGVSGYWWRIIYVQSDDNTEDCWFRVDAPPGGTAYYNIGKVSASPPPQREKEVFTTTADITLRWTGTDTSVDQHPNPYGPVRFRAVGP